MAAAARDRLCEQGRQVGGPLKAEHVRRSGQDGELRHPGWRR